MGRYVPPELEGVVSFNAASNKRVGIRPDGTQTVRFELPYSIWCTTCPKPTIIGQGVRFNAEKKKVGNYFSTPIFSFRFKHIQCGGPIEIRTDPKNTAYVVTEGAKKRDTGEDRLREGEVIIADGKTEEEKKRLEGDAFARLEEGNQDKAVAKTEKARIEQLYRNNERDWDDPGEANRRLRKAFRVGRKVRQGRAEATEALQERMGIGIDLLEETEEDKRRAGHVEFGDVEGKVALARAATRPMFSTNKQGKSGSKKAKSMKGAKAVKARKEDLRKELADNTRAVLDPFLGDHLKGGRPDPPPLLRKRKQEETFPANEASALETAAEEPNVQSEPRDKPTTALPLVDYDSD
ncbi:uncharacterized protein KY384_002737 [Bacidia gigantensis]|uniref:uncharacterized protein n=1 Tax=Bacidia gigantensis TaxID=2732470 RepID=UPI001D05BB45|nr:uncharacterized protein KY384_002737 [Bacidia gigantensis]KAG8532859.1 hypothetical protein KY384_002737 [Bacidia gigantensis]